MKKLLKLGLYTQSRAGHRGAYADYAKNLLGGEPSNMRKSLFKSSPVLFLMADHKIHYYFLAALFRALSGKRTVGLLFRPVPAVQAQTWSQRGKKILLKLLKELKQVKTLSIIPVPLVPETVEIVDGWIHDLQLWDLGLKERKLFDDLRAGLVHESHPAMQFYRQIKKSANGKPTMISLGAQGKEKGYSILADAVPLLAKNDWFVVAAGRVVEDQKEKTLVFLENRMMSVNRYLDDDEMIAAYAAADVVWCLYDPSYDQASGILGRAVQLGVLPLVRQGSLSEDFCSAENIPHLAAKGSDRVLEALLNCPESLGNLSKELVARMKKENTKRLHEAIWGGYD